MASGKWLLINIQRAKLLNCLGSEQSVKRKIIYGQLRFLLLNVATAAAAGCLMAPAVPMQMCCKYLLKLMTHAAAAAAAGMGKVMAEEIAGKAAGFEHNKSSEASHIKLTTKSLLPSHWLRSGQGK